jgi:hypothetical protein
VTDPAFRATVGSIVAQLEPVTTTLDGTREPTLSGLTNPDAAPAFVRQHQALLATRPVWLFSSGLLGPERTDTPAQGPRVAPEPREIADLGAAIGALDHRVFRGAFDRGQKAVGLAGRACDPADAHVPGGNAEGDFRNWAEIEAWAGGIAGELALAPATGRGTQASRAGQPGRSS